MYRNMFMAVFDKSDLRKSSMHLGSGSKMINHDYVTTTVVNCNETEVNFNIRLRPGYNYSLIIYYFPF